MFPVAEPQKLEGAMGDNRHISPSPAATSGFLHIYYVSYTADREGSVRKKVFYLNN